MERNESLLPVAKFIAEYAAHMMGSGVHTSRVKRSSKRIGKAFNTDIKLNVSAAADTTENPDTGANDVVGIATALAAVALVSAAAVSLKK